MIEKTCEDCLYEYQCDWGPAGDRPCCQEWRPEHREQEVEELNQEGGRSGARKGIPAPKIK